MTPRPRSSSGTALPPHQRKERGQAALGLVLALVLLLVTSGTLLATNAIQHDPLVQTDAVEHYAYRALEAGINSYLSTINAQPNLVTCDSTSKSSTCTNLVNGIKYDTWKTVPGTTDATDDAVPEYYLWTNPQLCFSTKQSLDTTCTTASTSGNLEYVQILVVGAAGTPGHFQYQRSVASFAPDNGFITHVWWSKYEAEPGSTTPSSTACDYDYSNSYDGPGTSCTSGTTSYHGAVFFGPGDTVNGPVFTDDSIYVATKPIFGTPTTCNATKKTGCTAVQTADPGCLFVTGPPGATGSSPATGCIADGTSEAYYTATNSRHNVAPETPPTTDTTLKTLAALHGCLYSGPTTISFMASSSGTTVGHKLGYMTVTSPETPTTSTTHTKDEDNKSTNANLCLGTDIRLPTGTPTGGGTTPDNVPNGVIYVETATGSCSTANDNPYEAVSGGVATGTRAQIKTGTDAYNETLTPTSPNCAGDAFVRDGPSTATPPRTSGVAGNLTVGAQTNIIVTGSLKYADCQSGFTSEEPCTYLPGLVNDSLGLIANKYVAVNRPECPPGKTLNTTVKEPVKEKVKKSEYTNRNHKYITVTVTTIVTVPEPNPNYDGDCVTSSGALMMKTCGTTVSGPTAALCDPGSTIVIDGAILALAHSFTVINYKKGGSSGHLIVYGAIDQYWRGPVGQFSGGTVTEGYSKYYTWDSRLQYVSVPSFLTPGTAAWTLRSSSVLLANACPTWPQKYPTGYAYVKTGTASATTTIRTAAKEEPSAPTGSLCT